MITAMTPIVRFGRRARAISVPLLAVGVLAAGCGTASYDGTPASGVSSGTGATAGTGSTAHAGSNAGAGSAAPATPVPTVSGGRVAAGGPACAGWPANAPSAALPVSFVPVSVERCVTGAQDIHGKGMWVTATLQRSDGGLAGLVNALRRPAGARAPGTMCPALAMIPPQIVLTDATGHQLIPRVPVTGCGLVQSQVLVALQSLHWNAVSVRLISQIPAASTAPAAGPSATVVGPAPKHSSGSGGIKPQ
jgi:hypothetical protein